MGCDAVAALVADTDGNVDQFFRKRIKRARRHDLLNVLPRSPERSGIVGQRLPEIINPVGLPRRHDVVVDGANFGSGVFVFDQAQRGHSCLQSSFNSKLIHPSCSAPTQAQHGFLPRHAALRSLPHV